MTLLPDPEGPRSTLLQHFVVDAIIRVLKRGRLPDSIFDPFVSEYLGKALAIQAVDHPRLREIIDRRPAALFSSIASLPDTSTPWSEEIAKAAHSWLHKTRNHWTSERHYALSLLQSVRSQLVVQVTEDLPTSMPTAVARACQGDVQAALFLQFREFNPASSGYFEDIMFRFLSWDTKLIATEIEALLSNAESDDGAIAALLTLAGYCGSFISCDCIANCWKKSIDRRRTLLAALWALLRSDLNGSELILSEMLDAVLQIEEDETGKSYSHRYSLLQRLGWASRHGYSQAALKALVRLGNQQRYRWTVLCILAEVNDPATTEFTTTELARMSHAAAKKKSFSSFAATWSDRWYRWRESGLDLSKNGDILFGMWRNRRKPKWLRSYALKVWAATADSPALLQSVKIDDPIYKSTLWHRAQLGDLTLTTEQATQIPIPLLEYVAAVWTPQLTPFFESVFEEYCAGLSDDPLGNNQFSIAHSLRLLPEELAETLLSRYWPQLRTRYLFIQAALAVATPRSLALAAEALSVPPPNAFHQIHWSMRVTMRGLGTRISLRQLDALKPYLRNIGTDELLMLAHDCLRDGHREWAKREMTDILSERQSSPQTDDPRLTDRLDHFLASLTHSQSSLLLQLDGVEKHVHAHYSGLEHFVESFIEQGGRRSEFCSLMFSWFDLAPSALRLRLLSEAIQYWGKRSDLPALEQRDQVWRDAQTPIFSEIQFDVLRRSAD